MSTPFRGLPGVLGVFASFVLGGQAQAGGRDGLIFYDSSGAVLDAVYAPEDKNVLSALPDAPFNTSMLAKATIIEDPNSTISDIVAITFDEGIADNAITFNSSPTDALLQAWPSARIVQETSRVDVSYLLSKAALAQGDSLIFVSSVPEPAAWATMVVGVGMSGVLLRRRRHLRTVLD